MYDRSIFYVAYLKNILIYKIYKLIRLAHVLGQCELIFLQ